MGNKNIKKENNNFKKEDKEINDINESKIKDEYKIVFIGESGTGAKTNLINRLTGIEFKKNLESTSINSYSDIKIGEEFQKEIILHLWDTIGQEGYKKINKIFMQNLDCAVIGYDITVRETFQETINYWYPTIKNEFDTCKLIYLIGNKRDLKEKRQVKKKKGLNLQKKKI